jgi:DNA-binding PadR family transcriptional regulator
MVLSMPKPTTPHRSPLGLIVLFQLFTGPMHVYGMQKLFEATAKDRVVNVRSRASLYQTIERLMRHGLVEVVETVRVEGYPDRVIYAVTESGRQTAREWLREMLHTTEGEYPEFLAALSLLFGLAPDEARAELELREQRLATTLADTKQTLAETPPGLPRLFTLEEEYRRAMVEAELSWLRGVIGDLRDGRLSWSEAWLRQIADQFEIANDQDNPKGG